MFGTFLLILFAAVSPFAHTPSDASNPQIPAPRITQGYFAIEAIRETMISERNGNDDTGATKLRADIVKPQIVSEQTTTFTSPKGPVAAELISAIGVTTTDNVTITYIYTYTYNRANGALLHESVAPADDATAHRFGFPVNQNLVRKKP